MTINCPKCNAQLNVATVMIRWVGRDNGVDVFNATCHMCGHEFSLKQARADQRARELPFLYKHFRPVL